MKQRQVRRAQMGRRAKANGAWNTFCATWEAPTELMYRYKDVRCRKLCLLLVGNFRFGAKSIAYLITEVRYVRWEVLSVSGPQPRHDHGGISTRDESPA